MSVALRTFITGTGIRIEATILDFDSPTPTQPYPDPDALYIDVDSNTITIYDDDGKLAATISSASVIHDNLGIYHADIALPTSNVEIGKWSALWVATKGSLPSKGRIKFNVVP